MNRSNRSPRSFSTDQLRTALGDVGGPALADYLPDIVAQAGRTRQRAAWTFLETWLPADIARRRRGVPRAVVLFAAVSLLVALVASAVYVGSRLGESERSPRLGVFGSVAGWIVYGDGEGIWGIDAASPAAATRVRLTSDPGNPLGWSRDGTELLIMRREPAPGVPFASTLFILHADGTETQLTADGMEIWGATIAPDGARVVYSAREVTAARSARPSLFTVDATGGQPIRIAEEGERPTFSPDGSQIAFAINTSAGGQVWVAGADGSDAHEILVDESTLLRGVDALAWSPTGERIAMEDQGEGHVAIYTFAPDGSGFTRVITGGFGAFWSPDGSQIAYLRPNDGPRPGLAIADADGSDVREFGFGASGPWHPGTLQ